jgi:hypothetical protein
MKAWKWKGDIISGDSQEINGVCKCHLSCNNAEMSRPSPGGRRATMISRSAVPVSRCCKMGAAEMKNGRHVSFIHLPTLPALRMPPLLPPAQTIEIIVIII